MRAGIAAATGTHVLIQDADLEDDPQDYLPMLRALRAGSERTVVYGSRYLPYPGASALRNIFAGPWPGQSWPAYLGGRSLSVTAWLTTGRYLTDTVTAYKLFPLALLAGLDLQTSGFELDHEISAKVIARGYRIVEVPIGYAPRSKAEGKKIGYRDWWRALRTFWRFAAGDLAVRHRYSDTKIDPRVDSPLSFPRAPHLHGDRRLGRRGARQLRRRQPRTIRAPTRAPGADRQRRRAGRRHDARRHGGHHHRHQLRRRRHRHDRRHRRDRRRRAGRHSLTARTPQHVAGPGDVVVTVAGRSATLPGGFRFEAPAATTNQPPIVSGISSRSSRPGVPNRFADLDETITVTATVTDAETPSDQLRYEWTADVGAFSGTGREVTWRAPAQATTPARSASPSS